MSVMSSIKRKNAAYSVAAMLQRKKEKKFNQFHGRIRRIVNGIIKNYIETQPVKERFSLRYLLHEHTDKFVQKFEVPNHYKDAVNFLVEHYKKVKADMGE